MTVIRKILVVFIVAAATLQQRSLALRCHKCIRFDCDYTNTTLCSELESHIIERAEGKYLRGIQMKGLPVCPPVNIIHSWWALENWKGSQCSTEKGMHCSIIGFEIRSRIRGDTKQRVSVGTISGCSIPQKKTADLPDAAHCWLHAYDLPPPNAAENTRNYNGSVIFRICGPENRCQCLGRDCDYTGFQDYCMNKTSIIPTRLTLSETQDSTIIGRYTLALVIIIMVILAAADKDFPLL